MTSELSNNNTCFLEDVNVTSKQDGDTVSQALKMPTQITAQNIFNSKKH